MSYYKVELRNMIRTSVLFLSISASLCLNKIEKPIKIQERITGGQEAYAGQFPWAAAIYLTTNNGNYFCGGALLSNLYVLTAGQCVDG